MSEASKPSRVSDVRPTLRVEKRSEVNAMKCLMGSALFFLGAVWGGVSAATDPLSKTNRLDTLADSLEQ